MEWGSVADWSVVILTVLGALVAVRAFHEQRDATRLTQRADVLISKATVVPPSDLVPTSLISIEFKNFGPTRASKVKLGAWLEFADISGPQERPEVVTTLGPGDSQSVAFDHLSAFMNSDTAKAINAGTQTLRFVAVSTYDDVFGKPHRTRSEAVYSPKFGNFQVTAHESD
jgi:hypothetical protein